MGGMKLQFSLATMLTCTAAVAITAAVCAVLPVQSEDLIIMGRVWTAQLHPSRHPNLSEFSWRLAWTVPVAIATTLPALWIVRRFWPR